MGFDRIAAGYQPAHRCGPKVIEGSEIAYGIREIRARGVDAAEYGLVFQYHIAHHQIGIDAHRRLAARHSSKDENSVDAQLLDNLER